MNVDTEYNGLVRHVLEHGTWQEGRNGRTKFVFGQMMRFNLEDNSMPLLLSKKVAWKTCLKELLWFIKGSTDNRVLKNENVHIWDANGSRDFLDSRGLQHLAEDDLGPVYGHQWRHFNATYTDRDADYTGKGVDQLKYIINSLNNPETRFSRRLVMSAWNPCQIDEMALPPCHVLCQFNVGSDNSLSLMLYQRSGDIGLGVPFNIASYSFLGHLIAAHCGLKAKELVHVIGNAHIYEDHIEALTEQINRPIDPNTYTVPQLFIKTKKDNIDDYTLEDFDLKNYNPQGVIKMKMSA